MTYARHGGYITLVGANQIAKYLKPPPLKKIVALTNNSPFTQVVMTLSMTAFSTWQVDIPYRVRVRSGAGRHPLYYIEIFYFY